MSGATAASRTAEVREYAAAVRGALADVPAERGQDPLEDLLEDLEEHLAEVAADGEEPLASRLGPPVAYAAELRAAAGLPAGPEETAGRRDELAELLRRLRTWEPAQHVERFLPELRPAWWVVRAWAAVTAVDVVFVGGTSFPVPTLGLGPIGLLATVAGVAWSVRRGLRARAEARPAGRTAVLANAGLGLLTLIAVVGLADRSDIASAEPVYYDQGPPAEGLTHEDGTPITNILPYSSTGEPLTGVLLYDQDGRPIDDLADTTVRGEAVEPVPGAPLQPGNAYPQQRQVITWGDAGTETTVPMPLPTASSGSSSPQSTTLPSSVPSFVPSSVPSVPPTAPAAPTP